jgi:hypothetical protein
VGVDVDVRSRCDGNCLISPWGSCWCALQGREVPVGAQRVASFLLEFLWIEFTTLDILATKETYYWTYIWQTMKGAAISFHFAFFFFSAPRFSCTIR